MNRRRRRGRAADYLPDVAVPERGAPRRLRVERDLHEQLALVLGALRDPRLADVVVTRVLLTDDLSFARIYVRVGVAGEAGREELMRGLSSAAGRIRSDLSQQMQLRRTPELRFIYDAGLENAERVEALLDELSDD